MRYLIGLFLLTQLYSENNTTKQHQYKENDNNNTALVGSIESSSESNTSATLKLLYEQSIKVPVYKKDNIEVDVGVDYKYTEENKNFKTDNYSVKVKIKF